MYLYKPEEWLIVKIIGDDSHYRVFGSWRGGYVSGDSWRMNSGITSVEKEGDYFLFYGKSGSIYKCHKEAYGVRSLYANTILSEYKSKLKDKFEILVKMPDTMNMDWIIK